MFEILQNINKTGEPNEDKKSDKFNIDFIFNNRNAKSNNTKRSICK